MIPLRTPAQIKKFPQFLLAFLSLSMLLSALYSTAISSSDSQLLRSAVSLFIFPSWSLALLCLWYLWIFLPCLNQRKGRRVGLEVALVPVSAALVFMFLNFNVEAAWGFVLSLLLLGFLMRDLIWSNVETLVIGPRLFSVFEVPSYVHVFFFLFYMFLSQLLRPAYGMPGKAIYLVSLVSFLVGFLMRSLELKGLKEA